MRTQHLVSTPDTLEIVFANRNKAYGAYQLRREYSTNLGRAFGFGLLLIGLLLLLPRILQAISFNSKPTEAAYSITEVNIAKKTEELKKATPPPPKVKTPPPVRAQIKSVPPVIMSDDKVKKEDPPATPEELLNSNKQIGKENREGTNDGPPEDPKPNVISDIIVDYAAKDAEPEYDAITVQKMPSFLGGEKELFNYLAKNIAYPQLAKEMNIVGMVVITFVVNKDGSVSNIELLKDIGGGCGKEAIRVVRNMPKWMPGENNGQPVKVRFTLPVRFQLN
ncbi:MAG: energy transducer TonB [Bacteroidota bacterium]